MYQSWRAGNEAKKRKSPTKSGRLGITEYCSRLQCTQELMFMGSIPWAGPIPNNEDSAFAGLQMARPSYLR